MGVGLKERKLEYRLIVMSRYILTRKVKKIMEQRSYQLICKICEVPILVDDCVESKQQRRGKSKLYHCECYDKSHIDIPDNGTTDEEVERFFKRPKQLLTEEQAINEILSWKQ